MKQSGIYEPSICRNSSVLRIISHNPLCSSSEMGSLSQKLSRDASNCVHDQFQDICCPSFCYALGESVHKLYVDSSIVIHPNKGRGTTEGDPHFAFRNTLMDVMNFTFFTNTKSKFMFFDTGLLLSRIGAHWATFKAVCLQL